MRSEVWDSLENRRPIANPSAKEPKKRNLTEKNSQKSEPNDG